jgi:hypothetical protein
LKRIRSLALTAGLLAVTAAPALALAGTASAAASIAPAPAHSTVMVVRHTFTIRHDGATVTETCVGYEDMNKSPAFPGYITGRAWVVGCSPQPAAACEQTANVQRESSHGWENIADGPAVFGCGNWSINDVYCLDSHGVDVNYRTQALYEAVTANGQSFDWTGYTPAMGATRDC